MWEGGLKSVSEQTDWLMTNTWQNQQEDTGLRMDYLSPEQKGMHDNGARQNVKEKKNIF